MALRRRIVDSAFLVFDRDGKAFEIGPGDLWVYPAKDDRVKILWNGQLEYWVNEAVLEAHTHLFEGVA
jgi:hypothetical protein